MLYWRELGPQSGQYSINIGRERNRYFSFFISFAIARSLISSRINRGERLDVTLPGFVGRPSFLFRFFILSSRGIFKGFSNNEWASKVQLTRQQ